MGLVSQVFDETTLNTLTGHLAVGHCRYSTTGASHWANAQPSLGASVHGHRGPGPQRQPDQHGRAQGNDRGPQRRKPQRRDDKQGNTSDTALVTALLEGEEGKSLEQTAMELLPKIKGGFCFVFMDEGTLYAARDTYGIRPLCLGRLERGWVVASEQSALATVGASFIREIEPGEFIAIDEDGVRSQRFAEATARPAAFSNTSTSPARTPPLRAARCTNPASKWAASWPAGTPRKRTSSSPCRNPAPPRRSATPKSPASPSRTASSRTPTWAARSSSPRRRCASSASGSS